MCGGITTEGSADQAYGFISLGSDGTMVCRPGKFATDDYTKTSVTVF